MRQRARRYVCLYCQKHKKQSVLLSEAHLHPGIAEAGRRADVHRRGRHGRGRAELLQFSEF